MIIYSHLTTDIYVSKMNYHIERILKCINKSATAIILAIVLFLILFAIPGFTFRGTVLALDNTSPSFLSTYKIIPSYYHTSNITVASLDNAGLNNSIKAVSNNFNNNDNYIDRMISSNAVVNVESNINKCNNSNSNTTLISHITPNPHNVLPPKIVMTYNGKEFDVGVLLNSKYREDTTFTQLQIPQEKINTHISNNSISLVKGSCVGFIIKNDPLALPPSSISVTAYDIEGKVVKLITTTEHSKRIFFNIDLNKGKYILLVVATWLPGSEKVTGYEEYNYLINVVNDG